MQVFLDGKNFREICEDTFLENRRICMEERKITLVDDDQTLEFYVVEETKLNGANYLLVTDAEDDDEEGDCYILKDMSGADESDALYEFVEDEDELEGLMKIFAELLDDVDLEKQ